MAAAENQAPENEGPQLCLDRGNEPSSNSVSPDNAQQQAVTPSDPMFQHSTQPESQATSMAPENPLNAPEEQVTGVDIQGTQVDLGCRFCSTIVAFMIAICSPGGESLPNVILGNKSDFLPSNSTCCHTTWLQYVKYTGSSEPLDEPCVLRLVRGPEQRTWATLWVEYRPSEYPRSSPACNFELVFRPEVPGHRGRSRILDENWIDIDLVKDWRSRCVSEHGERCDRRAWLRYLAPFRPRWLIDVLRGCIVPCEDEQPRFLTLSYTWGKTKNFLVKKDNIDDVRKPGALLSGPVAASIPETIRNAIGLTKALGETQLWVDSLCIVQDDEASLQHHIGNMHRIYATSFLTIIAEDGKDAEFGLRGLKGVSPARAVDHEVAPLAAGEKLLMIGKRLHQRKTSIYDYRRRMWTFQEWTFAKRRLTFTSTGTVKWECNCAGWDEHLYYYADGEASMDDKISIGLKSRVPSLNVFGWVVREFNENILTYDEDVLSAFSGIQTHFNGIFPSGLLFGHPEFFFDISLCWQTFRSLRRRTASDKFTGDPIIDGLPSWSWMGWHGTSWFPSNGEWERGPLGFTEPVTKWYCAASPSSASPRPINSRWHEFRAAAAEGQVELDGWGCLGFEPPRSLTLNYESRFVPQWMPKELPRHMYRRNEPQDADSTEVYWYPVPLPSEDLRPAEDEAEKSHEQQWQFIRCETTRAFLTGYSEMSWETLKECVRNPIQLLNDDQGNPVGGLFLHHLEDYLLFNGGREVELVAVVKGWTSTDRTLFRGSGSSDLSTNDDTDVRDDSNSESDEDGVKVSHLTASEDDDEEVCSSPGGYNPVEYPQDAVEDEDAVYLSDSEEEDNETWSHKSDEREGNPWIEEWEQQRQNKLDCVFVLWITWDHGIAYRKAFGYVLAEKWDKVKEPESIDLILG